MGHYLSEMAGYERPQYQYANYHELEFKTHNKTVSCEYCFLVWKIDAARTPPPPSILRHVDECPDRPEPEEEFTGNASNPYPYWDR